MSGLVLQKANNEKSSICSCDLQGAGGVVLAPEQLQRVSHEKCFLILLRFTDHNADAMMLPGAVVMNLLEDAAFNLIDDAGAGLMAFDADAMSGVLLVELDEERIPLLRRNIRGQHIAPPAEIPT